MFPTLHEHLGRTVCKTLCWPWLEPKLSSLGTTLVQRPKKDFINVSFPARYIRIFAKNRKKDTYRGRHLPVPYDVISGLWVPVLGRSCIAFQGQNCQPVVLSIDTRLKVNSISEVKLNGVIILSVSQDITIHKTKTLITHEYY